MEGEVGTYIPTETQGYISMTLVVTGVLNDSYTREVTCANRSEHETETNGTHS